MGSDSGREYNLTELFAIKFVLADVVIIATLLLAGPLYAVLITALFVLSFVLVWYLTTSDRGREDAEAATTDSATDPVTALQDRYAAGDLTDDEFEAKLERLIEANERADEAGIETEELELERSG